MIQIISDLCFCILKVLELCPICSYDTKALTNDLRNLSLHIQINARSADLSHVVKKSWKMARFTCD